MYIFIYTCICTYIYLDVHMNLYVYIYVYALLFLNIYICIYIYIYVYIYLHVHQRSSKPGRPAHSPNPSILPPWYIPTTPERSRHPRVTSLGGVTREQKMVEGRLPRDILSGILVHKDQKLVCAFQSASSGLFPAANLTYLCRDVGVPT